MSPEIPQGNKPTNTFNAGENSKASFSEFSDHPAFNVAIALSWVVALIAVLATMFFWLQSKNMTDALKEKTAKKATVEQEVNSANYTAIAKEITDFKASVAGLVAAKKDRVGFVDFLDQFSQRVTKTAVISSLGYDSSGAINMNGKAPTYRAVAELVVALKAWDGLKDVDLTSVSMTEPDEKSGAKAEAVFSLTAKITPKTTGTLTAGSGSTTSAGGN